MGEYFVYSPGYERRFAVACIVFGRIGVDAVYNLSLIHIYIIERGLNEDVIRLISAKKNEPEWLLEFRLKAYRYCCLLYTSVL